MAREISDNERGILKQVDEQIRKHGIVDPTISAEGMASKCRFGDPTCPCQDGDVCHYEPLYDEKGIISQPLNVPPEYVLNAIRQAEQAAYERAAQWHDQRAVEIRVLETVLHPPPDVSFPAEAHWHEQCAVVFRALAQEPEEVG